MKRVRMLVDRELDGLKYRADQVVDFPDALAKELVNLGEADAHRDAVAYCTDELKQKPLVHETEALRAAKAAVEKAEQALEAAGEAVLGEADAAKRAELVSVAEAAEQALAEARAKLSEAAK